ncbi:MAG: MarC family protein [Planctomycetota bacterium]|nr:MarC family protein [Planctomycetota bacterium]
MGTFIVLFMSILAHFLTVFIPLLVAIDPFGMLPVFLAVTGDMPERRRRRVAIEAVLTATLICLIFMFLGTQIFRFLSITENDFRIAGGILLLVLAVLDLLHTGKPAVHEPDIVGIVPLAMPLIAGPATLTTLLVLATRGDCGYVLTTVGLLVNFTILLAVMLAASTIARFVGLNVLRAFSKLVMVLLAAIAVNFIRSGITNVIHGR